MTGILFSMLWGIFLAVTQVSRVFAQIVWCNLPEVGIKFILLLIFCRFSNNDTNICFSMCFGWADIWAGGWAPLLSAWAWKCSSTWTGKIYRWTVSCPLNCAQNISSLDKFHLSSIYWVVESRLLHISKRRFTLILIETLTKVVLIELYVRCNNSHDFS